MRALVNIQIYIRDQDEGSFTAQQILDYATVLNSLTIGLTNRNNDYVTTGAPTKDGAMDVLLMTAIEFAGDTTFLTNTKTSAALANLYKLVSYQWRTNPASLPLGPRALGAMLKYLGSSSKRIYAPSSGYITVPAGGYLLSGS